MESWCPFGLFSAPTHGPDATLNTCKRPRVFFAECVHVYRFLLLWSVVHPFHDIMSYSVELLLETPLRSSIFFQHQYLIFWGGFCKFFTFPVIHTEEIFTCWSYFACILFFCLLPSVYISTTCCAIKPNPSKSNFLNTLWLHIHGFIECVFF